MGIPSYSAAHIRWAVRVEESGLPTPDFLNRMARTKGYYLEEENYQKKVEQARHFIFDELPERSGSELQERMVYHLLQFFNVEDSRLIYNRIIMILSHKNH
jgi:hypothetical protein